MRKEVKIIGLSIKENFGTLKATELTFDENMHLTMIKGEVGAGKSTLNKAMRLTTQGSSVLEDKTLYGDNVFLETQLVDGDKNIFVGCKSGPDGNLAYFLYELDSNGKKINDVVLDGVKATPANYLKSMQTALTWRLDELTSENPTTQRNILLELYQKELEEHGVILDKKHPNYVGGIIDQIEKAKEKRNYLDMKRKEVGGIADDMSKKGIDFSERSVIQDEEVIKKNITTIEAEISIAQTNIEQTRANTLTEIKLQGSDLNNKLRAKNDEIKAFNKPIEEANKKETERSSNLESWCRELQLVLNKLFADEQKAAGWVANARKEIPEIVKKPLLKELSFNENGSCISKPEEFADNEPIKKLLDNYIAVILNYKKVKDSPLDAVDTSVQERKLKTLQQRQKDIQESNKTAEAVNAFLDWKEQNEEVANLNKDYFLKLTKIQTGVQGLYICPEYTIDADGKKMAKGNDIYLMYDGSYDTKYFNNPGKEIRKLSSYSDTQKPMICLLVQNYLLSKKSKILPYLWIDQVPIDLKTKELLDRMSEELGLWLFVNWTGDFDKATLKDGEILVENGEIFFNYIAE